MKKVKAVGIFTLLLFICAGCGVSNNETSGDLEIPVQTITVVEETQETYFYNVGVITALDLIKYSFKSGGTLSETPVRPGDEVLPGAVLAVLDQSDLQLAVDAAQAERDAAKAQYDKAVQGATSEEKRSAELNLNKAEDAFRYAEETYQRIQKLYEVGGVSDSDLNKAKLEYDLRASELQQAQELNAQAQKGAREEDILAADALYRQAQINYQAKQKMLQEASLRAVGAGTVVDVLYEQGEIVAAGYPVVVVRGEAQAVIVGLTQEEVALAQLGQEARVEIDNQIVAGQVTAIGEAPDAETRMYEVEVTLSEGQYRLGSIARTYLITGKETGIWLPVDCIRFAGEDYVYVVREGVVAYQPVTRLTLHENRVLVEGLQAGEQVIVGNADQIKTGDSVRIVK